MGLPYPGVTKFGFSAQQARRANRTVIEDGLSMRELFLLDPQVFFSEMGSSKGQTSTMYCYSVGTLLRHGRP